MYRDGRGLAERQGLLGGIAGLRQHSEPARFRAHGAALVEQGRQRVAKATVVDAEGFAQSLASHRRLVSAQDLPSRVSEFAGISRVDHRLRLALKVQMGLGSVRIGLQRQLDGRRCLGSAVLKGEEQVVATAGEISVAVPECVEVRRAAQRLAGLSPLLFAGVVHEDDSGVGPALQVPQVTKKTADFACAVFIQSMQAYQRIQQEQSGLVSLDRCSQTSLIWL